MGKTTRSRRARCASSSCTADTDGGASSAGSGIGRHLDSAVENQWRACELGPVGGRLVDVAEGGAAMEAEGMAAVSAVSFAHVNHGGSARDRRRPEWDEAVLRAMARSRFLNLRRQRRIAEERLPRG